MRRVKTGSDAVADAVFFCKPQVIASYPITPQTHIMERLAGLVAEGRLEAEYICTDSEISSIGVVAGAVAEGVRAFTATASHGLALMHEALHWVAGGRLPVVMVVATRGLGAPWILMTDHQDALSQRDTGWMMVFASNCQEAQDFVPIAYRVSEEVHIPCMVCMDGFLISHTAEPVEELYEELIDSFLPPFTPRLAMPEEGTLWPIPDPIIYYRIREEFHRDHELSGYRWEEAFRLWREMTGREYDLVDAFMMEDAKVAIVAMGATGETVKEAVKQLRTQGERVGALVVKLFRPFPGRRLREIAGDVERVLVVDRAVSFGKSGILAESVASVVDVPVKCFVGSMGGRDLPPELVLDAFKRAWTFEGDVLWM